MTTPTSTPPSAAPGPAGPPSSGERAGWNAGRVIAVVFGSLGALVGVALLLAGAAVVLAHAVARDEDGYYTSGTERLATGTYAIVAEDVDLGSDAADVVPEDVLGRVRIRAERPGGGDLFVGIGPEREVAAYLRGVARAELDDLDPPSYTTRRGGPPRRPPSSARFWVASAEGPGRQALDWEVETGQWTIVAMNADGGRRVVLDADIGAKVGWFLWVGIGLLALGLLILAVGVVLILGAVRRASRPRAPTPA